MAKISSLELLWSLCLTSFLFTLVNNAHTSGYTEYTLESETICPMNKRTVDTTINKAVLVRSSHIFDRWVDRGNLECKFKLKTTDHQGLFAIIQKMSLRKNNDSQCIDYVTFEWDDDETPKRCDTMDRKDMETFIISTKGQQRFEEFNPRGKIKTKIFISKERLQPGQVLDLSILYTPYKDCKKVNLSEYAPVGHNVCILKEYICDGYHNCAENVCSDEVNCTDVTKSIVSNSVGTKVTIGAVTTIFLTFIIFVMCLWICRKHKKLCWSADCAGPNVRGSRDPSEHLDCEIQTPIRPPIPTAPSEEVTTQASDKDLPPSYDSLFPEQTNRSTAT